ncbi:MAG: response regulator [Sulfuricaulis sp.]
MNEAKLPSDLHDALKRLRHVGADTVSRLTALAESETTSTPWASKIIAALGTIEGVLAVVLDQSARVTRQGRVLVVDDQSSNRLMMRTLLESGGFDVIEADTLKSAIAQLDASRFAILITDIHLSDGTGMDVLDHARGHLTETGQPLPLIAMSADSSPEIVDAVFDRGASWIHKSDVIRDLPDVVARLVKTPAAEELGGVVDRSQFDLLATLVTAPSARMVVERSLDEVAAHIDTLPRMRVNHNEWRQMCRAIHGTSVFLGAIRMRERLDNLVAISDVELTPIMDEQERGLHADLAAVRDYYKAVLPAA